MTEYRVDALAEAAGLTVEVVRSYQSKGLLPPPRHRGRVAVYDTSHLERLRTICDLKTRGHSLRAIGSMLADAPAGRQYREAVLGPEPEHLTFAQLAERGRVHPSLLRSLEASGLVRPLCVGDERRYTGEDVRAVRMLLTLVGSGVPLEEFMTLARTQLEAATTVAEGAVDLFLRYVREPLLEADLSPEQEAARLVTSFRHMLQAATALISYNIERMMLNLVEEEIERLGTGAEREALHREVAGRRPGAGHPA